MIYAENVGVSLHNGGFAAAVMHNVFVLEQTEFNLLGIYFVGMYDFITEEETA